MKIAFVFNEAEYVFDTSECITDGTTKDIYIGRFLSADNSSAPGETELDTDYCLKRIHVQKTEAPQGRDYWDLIPFKGENLKEILASDDTTAEVVDKIRNRTALENLYSCMIIEPVYSVFNPRDFSDHNKLEVLLHVIKGLKQLQTNQGELKLTTIMAHRDMKIQNIMIEWNGDKFTVKIIDFASLKFLSGDTAGTRAGAMSLSNTTPEHVLGYKPYKGTDDERTDVFALGMMLAEIFDVVTFDGKLKDAPLNPLMEWFMSHPGDNNSNEKYVELYENVIRKGSDADASHTSWLEKEFAGTKYRFNFPDGEFGKALRRLFYDSTRLKPGDRISLKQFADRLVELQGMLTQANNEYSVFLFDANGYDDHCTEYITSATRVFLANHHDGMRVEMFVYGNAEGRIVTSQYFDDVVRHLKPRDKDKNLIKIRSIGSVSRTIELYRDSVKKLVSGGYKVNGLGVALYKAYEYIKKNEGFNGRIYVFSHDLPAKSMMCSVAGTDNVTCSFDRIVSMLSECGQIVCYSHNEDKSGDAWCSRRRLCKLSGSVSTSTEDDGDEDEGAPEKVTPEKKATDFTNSVFIRIGGKPVIVSKKIKRRKK